MIVTAVQLGVRCRSQLEAVEYARDLILRTKGSDLVLLPELWPVGYFSFECYAERAESIAGPTVTAMRQAVREIRAHVLIGSFVEKRRGRLYNTSLLLRPDGSVTARYRKIHLFGFRSKERRLLARGSRIALAAMPWGRTGLATCYDLRFPELFRRMSARGAECFLVAAAWPEARHEAWELFNRARAHENLAYLFACNCAGQSKGGVYAGRSMFVNPLGEVIAKLGTKEGLLTAEIDLGLVRETRRRFPALSDRILV